MIVVDDRLLFEVLSGAEPAEFVALASGGFPTTFSWFYRLSRAISTGRVDGSLTREFATLSDARRTEGACPLRLQSTIWRRLSLAPEQSAWRERAPAEVLDPGIFAFARGPTSRASVSRRQC